MNLTRTIGVIIYCYEINFIVTSKSRTQKKQLIVIDQLWHLVRMVVEYNMNTGVHVDGIRRKVEPRKRVMKHRRLFCEGVPVGLGDAITCFTTMDCGDRGCTGDFSKKKYVQTLFFLNANL